MSLEIRIWRFIRGFYFRAGRRLQFMIIRTDVFKMSVLHSKSLWNCAQLYKANLVLLYRQWVAEGRKIPMEEMIELATTLLEKGMKGFRNK